MILKSIEVIDYYVTLIVKKEGPQRKLSDPSFIMKQSVRTRTNNVFNLETFETTNKTIGVIGCSHEFFKKNGFQLNLQVLI